MKVSPLYVGVFFLIAVIVAGQIEHSSDKLGHAPITNAQAALAPATGFQHPGSDVVLEAADRYIENNYGSQKLFAQALMDYAKTSEKFMFVKTPQAAYAGDIDEGHALDCVFYVARTIVHANTNLPLNAVDRIHALLTDTDDRAQAWSQAMQLLGTNFYPGVPSNQESTTCSSDIDLPTPGIVTAQETNNPL
ncbi:MAG: hypothetical protein KGI54_04545 [Pseudomonadota bacterium]|nr:hypothetical protein [Pseudomonadota bacterium]